MFGCFNEWEEDLKVVWRVAFLLWVPIGVVGVIPIAFVSVATFLFSGKGFISRYLDFTWKIERYLEIKSK